MDLYNIEPKSQKLKALLYNSKYDSSTHSIKNKEELYLLHKYSDLIQNYNNKYHYILNEIDSRLSRLKIQISTLKHRNNIELNLINSNIKKIQHIYIRTPIKVSSHHISNYDNIPIYIFLNNEYNIDYIDLYNIKISDVYKNICVFFLKYKLRSDLINKYNIYYVPDYNYDLSELKTDFKLHTDNYENYGNNICYLFEFENIQKKVLDYKNYYLKQLQQNNNKNKALNNQIKALNTNINSLDNDNFIFINTIKLIRNERFEFYKTSKKPVFTSFIKILVNNGIDFSSINECYFFDTKEVFLLLNKIKLNKNKIILLNKEIYNLKHIKIIYNSTCITNIHQEIKNINKNTYGCDYSIEHSNEYNKNKNEINLFEALKYYIDTILDIKNNLTRQIYPIIIYSKEKFKLFEHNLGNIFIKFLRNQIQNSERLMLHNDKQILLLTTEYELNYNIKSNIKINNKLDYNYNYFKTKLNLIENKLLQLL